MSYELREARHGDMRYAMGDGRWAMGDMRWEAVACRISQVASRKSQVAPANFQLSTIIRTFAALLYLNIFMKKISIIIALSLLLSAGFTACMEEGDFDTDTISLKDLRPTALLPLIQDTLTLNGRQHVAYDRDTAMFLYHIDHLAIPSKDEWLVIPDVHTGFSMDYPHSSVVSEEIDYVFTFRLALLTGSDRELDSLFCSGLPVGITLGGLPALDAVHVTFPQILVNGQPYERDIQSSGATFNGATAISVPACKIVPKDKRDLEVRVRLKGRIYAPVRASLNVSIQNILEHYTAVFGYFGQVTSEVKDSVALNVMDDLHITAEMLEFDMLKIAADIKNATGIPFRLTLNAIRSYDGNGQLLATDNSPGKHINILAAPNAGAGSTAVTTAAIHCNGFGQMLSRNTRKIVFSFACASNPDGHAQNFLKADGNIEPAVDIQIPLYLKARGLKLQDTVGVNLSSVSLQGLKLQMHYKNTLPAAAVINVLLLDESNAPIAEKLIDNAVIAAGGETDPPLSVTVGPDLLGALRHSTRAIATVDIDTGTDYVAFRKDQYLTVKIGAEVKFLYNDLLK
jgi:hypothetical protein